jgi:sulfur-oxidizing protein SoxY
MVIPFKASVSILLMLLLPVAVAAQQSTLDVWTTLLKPHHFGDVEVIEDRTVIDLVTPYRAEDAAVTPVHIKAMIPQTAERYIKTIYLFVDKNPEPLVGIFEFTEEVGRADLALRIRVDKYTDVRAVAVLNDGAHHMVANFVKAQGGCAIPLSIDYNAAMANIGQVQLKLLSPEEPDDGIVTQLRVRHPNLTGMQMDYKIYAVRPAHYVQKISVFLDGRPLMTAETGISVSEDPSFRFFLKPRAEGELTAEITDSKGTTWSESIAVGVGGAGLGPS